MRSRLLPSLLWSLPAVVVAAAPAFGQVQGPLEAIPDIWQKPVVYEDPLAAQVHASRDLVYRSLDCGQLRADFYYPPGYSQGQALPAVLLFNGIGDLDEAHQVKNSAPFQSWARLLAATGVVAVTANAHRNHAGDDLHELIHFLQSSGTGFGVDGRRLGLLAASTSAAAAVPLLQGEVGAHLDCVALLYGAPESGGLPPSLPALVVAAGRDDAEQNGRIHRLVDAARAAGAPVTLLSYEDGGHAFDLLDDSRRSKATVKSILEFFEAQLLRPAAEAAPLAAGPVPPPSVTELRQQATAHQQGGRYAEAATLFRKILEAEPDDGLALFNLGYCLIPLGQYDQALDIFQRTAAGGTATTASTYNVACCYARKGQSEAALQWLAQAVSAGFNDPAFAQADADLASLRGDPRFAAILSGQPYAPPAAAAAPAKSVQELWNEAQQAFAAHRWYDAIKGYQAVLKQDPHHGPAHFNFGYAAIQVGHYDAAVHAFERAAENNFRPEICLYNLACCYSLKKENGQALTFLNRAFASGFNNLELARTDPDLDNIRADPMFQTILDNAGKKSGGG